MAAALRRAQEKAEEEERLAREEALAMMATASAGDGGAAGGASAGAGGGAGGAPRATVALIPGGRRSSRIEDLFPSALKMTTASRARLMLLRHCTARMYPVWAFAKTAARATWLMCGKLHRKSFKRRSLDAVSIARCPARKPLQAIGNDLGASPQNTAVMSPPAAKRRRGVFFRQIGENVFSP